jgi:hypothetical protein
MIYFCSFFGSGKFHNAALTDSPFQQHGGDAEKALCEREKGWWQHRSGETLV